MLTRIIWVLAVSLPLTITAQQPRKGTSARKPQKSAPTVRFDSGDSALQIPLDIDNNIIRMQVRVNDSKPLKFIFDTGASHSANDKKGSEHYGMTVAFYPVKERTETRSAKRAAKTKPAKKSAK